MSERIKKAVEGRISDLTDDLPTFVNTTKPNNSMAEKDEIKDTVENLDVVGGERIEPDTHTLVRTNELNRGGKLRESLVAMKEGVPGIYSGYERTSRKYSKLSKTDSDQDLENLESESLPVRPPRKARGKSNSSQNGEDYDKLWTPRDANQHEENDRTYSVLGSPEDRLYDDVEEGNAEIAKDREIILNSSPIKDEQWIEDGRRFDVQGGRGNRPMSAVVLPISPVEENEAWDSDSDDGDDWGSDFDSVNIPPDDDEAEDDIYEVVGDLSKKNGANRNSVYEDLSAVRARTAAALKTPPSFNKKPLPPVPMKPLPPVPDDSTSLNEQDEETVPYVDIIYAGGDVPQPSLPPLGDLASEEEIKRYQIIKYILENEKMYLTTVRNLIQDYEKPLRNSRIISQDSVKVIFQNLQEIEQCHQLFNIALLGRMAEWSQNATIGDILYASFSKSMVLNAYTSYVKNFTSAMDRVKETCRSVPAFLSFLRSRLKKSLYKYSFYDLLKRPLGRFPQLVVLLQELLKVTPICHEDRLPLQMALTHLECLSELICDKRRDMEMKYKVSQLDKYFVGLSKPLFSDRRYYIRHDDMFLCKVIDGRVVKTKHRRLFLLSDLLICASIINKTNAANVLARKRYRVKWCVPVVEVDVLDVGSGILVNIDHKTTTTIKYTHPVSSPRPGAINVEQHLEDLQHDLALIGKITGLVASLRKNYDVIDVSKVGEWYRDVKETFDQELDMANMHWLELSIPAKDKKTTTCLFNLHPPEKKIQWTTELENTKLRLAYDNNPGWYILEDESANIGNMGILRRNLPLLANKVPLLMVETKFSIERILEITPHGSTKPVLWIFSGNDHTGQITLMEMSMSSVPHVIESFVACKARILAVEAVKDETNRFADTTEQKTLVWCGTMSGSIHIYNASSGDHEEIVNTKLRDAVLCFKYTNGKVFTGVANGTIACFQRKADMSWDIDNPVLVCLSNSAVMDMTEARGRLWCASGNCVYVLDIDTLGTEQKIQVGTNSRVPVKHLVSYGSGVWASQWKTPKLHLYHNETFECIQSLSVTTPLMRMRSDVDSRIQNVNIDKTHVTALLARGGLLWVGTDNGIVVTYPLPRLGGVPQVSGRPCVSFHGHENAVRCLHAFRVERAFQPRRNAGGVADDAIARSLFYVDPFDAAASSLNYPYPELANEDAASSLNDAENEPFYFALEPEDGSTEVTASQPKSSYERWLKSFGENVKKVDPLFSSENLEMRNRQGSYNSDESMDSDTEFSFIEDKGRAIPPRVEKNATSFSVEIKQPSETDGDSQAIVMAKNDRGGMPVINEIDFADMLGKFEGFDSPKENNATKTNVAENTSASVTEADFVMVGRTDSGYEEPIPAADKIVTAPYAMVSKKTTNEKAADEKATEAKATEAKATEVKANEAKATEAKATEAKATTEGVEDSVLKVQKPCEEAVEKYKNEPLPDLPEKTLYEKSREWNDSLDNGYENCKSTVHEFSINDHRDDDGNLKRPEKDPENETEVADGVTTQGGNVSSLQDIDEKCSQAEAIEDVSSEKSVEGMTNMEKDKEGKKKGESMNKEERNRVEETAEEEQGSKKQQGDVQLSTSAKGIPLPDLPNMDEPELDFGNKCMASDSPHERNVKSPTLFIKVTDVQTQLNIEATIETDPASGLPREGRVESFSGHGESEIIEKVRERSHSDFLPKSDTSQSGLPWSSQTGRRNRENHADAAEGMATQVSKTLPPIPKSPASALIQTPKQLDLSTTKKVEEAESIYTPLFGPNRELNASSLSGVGEGAFETEMALSTSLAREKIAKQSMQGQYASLVSVSNRDDESRLELLMKPMYVVSVGAGYMDLRRKQKLGSGLDFFTKLTASEPEPKLLIWKVTT